MPNININSPDMLLPEPSPDMLGYAPAPVGPTSQIGPPPIPPPAPRQPVYIPPPPVRTDLNRIQNFQSVYDQYGPQMLGSIPEPNMMRDAILGTVDVMRARQGLMPIPRPDLYQRQYAAQQMAVLKAMADMQHTGEQARGENFNSYDKYAETYRDMENNPYVQRALEGQASQREGAAYKSVAGGDVAYGRLPYQNEKDASAAETNQARAYQYTAQGDQINALTDPKADSFDALANQRNSSAKFNEARTQTENDTRPYDIQKIKAEINKLRASSSTPKNYVSVGDIKPELDNINKIITSIEYQTIKGKDAAGNVLKSKDIEALRGQLPALEQRRESLKKQYQDRLNLNQQLPEVPIEEDDGNLIPVGGPKAAPTPAPQGRSLDDAIAAYRQKYGVDPTPDKIEIIKKRLGVQ